MQEMKFQTAINATKERVWDTLWQDATFRQWAGLIDPETYMVGELIEGQEVQFISAANGYGVTSLVEEVTPGEYLLLQHEADTQDSGNDTREKQWTGGKEVYELLENDGVTTLTITFDVPGELEEIFNVSYPKALARIKELAEAEN